MKQKISNITDDMRKLGAVLRAKFVAYLRWRYSWVTSSVAVFVLVSTVALILSTQFGSAISATLVPNSDVTAGWPATGGTTDSTCAGGTHCDFVDEGTTDKTSDYISTSGSTNGGEVEEYGLTSPADVSTATQVVIRVYAQSTTNANGGTLDDLSINLRVNSTLQTAGTCTPAYNTWTVCTATFNGSWNQAAVDSMQAQITRVRLGSGNPSGQADTLQIANVYGTLTYTSSIALNQSAYKWFSNADASSPVTYSSAWGGSAIENPNSAVATSDGGYAVTGYTTTFGVNSNADMLLGKYTAAGKLSWSKTWGGTGTERGNSVIQTSDGGYAVTGYTTTFGAGSNDMFLAKYTSTGTMSWSKTWGSASGLEQGNSVIQTSDGGYLVTGATNYMGPGGQDIIIVKYTSTGTMSWSKTWGSAGGNEDAKSVIQSSDDGYVVVGQTTGFGAGGNDAFIAKFTSTGTLSWSKTWGSGPSYNEVANAVVQADDGGFVMTGYTYGLGSSTSNGDVFIAKYTSTGTLSWSKTWGGSTSTDQGSSLVATDDGGYAVTGYTGSFGAGSLDIFLAKYTSTGTLSWSKTWGSAAGSETGNSVFQTTDGGYIVIGSSSTLGSGGGDIVMVKYDGSGDVASCGSYCNTDGTNYTSTNRSDGTDYTSTTNTDGTDYTSTTYTDGGAYTSVQKTDGTDYTSTRRSDGTDYTSTLSTIVALSPTNIDVSTQLAAQDTAATAPAEGTAFRLKLEIHVSGAQVTASSASLKLRYAAKGGAGSCSAVPSGSYADVTDTSTIRYYDNTNAVSGMTVASNASDPVHGTDTPAIYQTYQEKGTTTFTNTSAISVGQDGMWDFALVGYHTLQNTTYCFKVTKSDNTALNTYTVFPEITTPAASFTQQAYRWFDSTQEYPATFGKAWAVDDFAVANDVVQTSDGGYAVTGSTTYIDGSFLFHEHMYIAKYTSDGDLSWSKTWGGTSVNNDIGYSIAQTSDGGYAVTGSTTTYDSGGGVDMFLAKYTSTGTLSWSKTWGGANDDEGKSLVQTSDDGYAVTGITSSFGAGSQDTFLAKYTSTGTLSWSKTWGGTGNDAGNAIVQTSDSGYAVAGATTSFSAGGNSDAYLAKFTSAGALSWSKLLDSAYDEGANDLVQTSDGGYAITGYGDAFGGGTATMFLAKYTSAGALSWGIARGGSAVDSGSSLVQTSDGGYAVAGSTYSFGSSNKISVNKFTSTGSFSWGRLWNTGSDDTGSAIVQTSDGGYAVAGDTAHGYALASQSAVLFKYDSSGDILNCDSQCKTDGSDYTSTNYTSNFNSYAVEYSDGTDYTSSVNTDGTNYTSTVGSPSAATGSDGTDYTSSDTVIYASSLSSVSISSAMAPTNTPYDMPTLAPVYLGVVTRIDGSGVALSGQSFKLQYAIRGSASTCSAVSGGSYADITGSTPVQFYNNPSHTDKATLLSSGLDPTDGSRAIQHQNYVESNNFSNDESVIYAGEDGMWMFSLAVDGGSLKGKDYCLRIATSGGSQLSANNIGEIAYAPLMNTLMSGGNWFSRQGEKQHLAL